MKGVKRWSTNDPFCPPVNDEDGHFEQIRNYFIQSGELTIWTEKGNTEQDNLKQKVHSLYPNTKTGLVYVATSLAVLFNARTKLKRHKGILFEMMCVIPGRPASITSIVDREEEDGGRIDEYTLQLTQLLTKKVRQFTDESISFVYGTLDSHKLDQDGYLEKTLRSIASKTSKFCSERSLLMSEGKCEDIIDAVIGAIGTTDLVSKLTNEQGGKEELFFLTKEQFEILIENIHKKSVTVEAEIGAGSTLLALEIARRLENTGTTRLYAEGKYRSLMSEMNLVPNVLAAGCDEGGNGSDNICNIVALRVSNSELQKIKDTTKTIKAVWSINPFRDDDDLVRLKAPSWTLKADRQQQIEESRKSYLSTIEEPGVLRVFFDKIYENDLKDLREKTAANLSRLRDMSMKQELDKCVHVNEETKIPSRSSANLSKKQDGDFSGPLEKDKSSVFTRRNIAVWNRHTQTHKPRICLTKNNDPSRRKQPVPRRSRDGIKYLEHRTILAT